MVFKHPFCVIVLLTFLVGISCQRGAQQTNPDNWRAFFTDADIPQIQKNLASPLLKDWWQQQLDKDLATERLFYDNELDHKNVSQHLRRVMVNVSREAFIYRVTGDTVRGDFARRSLQELFQFERWDYVIEADSISMGLLYGSLVTKTCAQAYDWLNDRLTPDEKKQLLQQLGDKGCEPCYRALYQMIHPEEIVGWTCPEDPGKMKVDVSNWAQIVGPTNFRAAMINGLAHGTLLLRGTDPRAEKWLDMVRETYPYVVDLFEEDGGYSEGTGYANGTASSTIQLLTLVERHLAENWKNSVNWKKQIEFLKMTRMPSYSHKKGFVNFGDGGQAAHSNYGFWVANELQSQEIQWLSMHEFGQHSYFSAIFYNSTLPAKPPAPLEGGWEYKKYSIGWAVLTTGMELDDLVVAMRSGPPANHEHADRNSIILKAYGENLLNDKWHPAYGREKPGWVLRGSLAHNCVVIDGKGHQYVDGSEGTNPSLAEAKIIAEERTDSYVTVTSDATQAYQLVNENVESVIRTMLVIPDVNFLLVLDQLKSTKPADFAARWFVENKDGQATIKLKKNQFELIRPHARFAGCCAAGNGLNLSRAVFPIAIEEGVYPYLNVAAANRLTEQTLLMAGFATEKSAKKGTVRIKAIDNGWQVWGKVAGTSVEIKIQTNEMIPQIDVSL